MESYKDSEIIALKEFRDRVSDILPDEYSRKDENLIRWLRARDLNIEKAEEMLRDSMTWREENKIDQILQSGLDPDMVKMFPFYTDGISRDGGVVITIPFGQWDCRKCVEDEGPEKLNRYLTQFLEMNMKTMKKMHENSISNHPHRVRYDMVVDMTGYSFRQLANMKGVQTLLQAVSRFEAFYPETLNTAFIVNAPTVFSILFGLMKPLMAAATISKMQIFNSNRNEWEEAVLKIVSPTEIREQFGGTKLN